MGATEPLWRPGDEEALAAENGGLRFWGIGSLSKQGKSSASSSKEEKGVRQLSGLS